MKKLVLLLLMLGPVVCNAQTMDGKYYIYNIVSFVGDFTKEDFKERITGTVPLIIFQQKLW